MSRKTPPVNFTELTRGALLQTYAPASVVTDLQGNILYVHGETAKYLRLAPGQATLNVVEMARGGLRLDLQTAISAAVHHHLPTVDREVEATPANDHTKVSLSVRQLSGAEPEEVFLLISFKDIHQPTDTLPATTEGQGASTEKLGSVDIHRITELERQLAQVHYDLQATREVQQSTNEEYRSANEEMQSTNEELNSTNEELETSHEELQSINEELVTVNTELHNKIEQLAEMQNDMKNLLDNINNGTLFLDQDLAIRRFTREATRIYRLVEADVGRALTDIKSNLEGGDLTQEAQAVLDTLKSHECQVQTEEGGIYLARIQPYRTLQNRITGVVLTFTDIAQHVRAERSAQAARSLAEGIVDTVREPLLVLDAALRVVSASRAFYEFFQVKAEDTLGRHMYELGAGQWDIPALRELLENLLPTHTRLDDYDVSLMFPAIGERKLRLNARRIVNANNKASHEKPMILLAMTATDIG